MPFLKQKILKARQQSLLIKDVMLDDEVPYKIIPLPQISIQQTKPERITKITSTKKPRQSNKPKQAAAKKPKDKSLPSSKNIVKNYGKAMCSFAASELSMPYLTQIHEKQPFNIETFQNSMREKRDDIDSIDSVRKLLLVRDR